MAAQKGHKKVGGRQKGTPNKENRALIEQIRDLYPDYHPVIAMAKIASTTKSEALRLKANAEVAKYICPQLKSIDMTGTVEVSNHGVIMMMPSKTTKEEAIKR